MGKVGCPVCQGELSMSPTESKKNQSIGLMLVCRVSGSHFRAFINDQAFVRQVMENLEELWS